MFAGKKVTQMRAKWRSSYGLYGKIGIIWCGTITNRVHINLVYKLCNIGSSGRQLMACFNNISSLWNNKVQLVALFNGSHHLVITSNAMWMLVFTIRKELQDGVGV
jgi:hypothetical protein